MKKFFLVLGICLCAVGIGFGAWKFQIEKYVRGSEDRNPASVEEASEDSENVAVEEKQSSENEEKNEAKEEHPEEVSIKLQKINKTPVKASVVKPTPAKATHEDGKKSVKHIVGKDETAWFLASVYYGKGQDYKKILEANHLKSAEELKEGLELEIADPQFHKGQSNFAAHYNEVWQKRAKALKDRNKPVQADKYLIKAPMPSSKVVIPTKEIRAKDTTPQFPFTEVHDSHPSPAENAKEVLRQSFENRGK